MCVLIENDGPLTSVRFGDRGVAVVLEAEAVGAYLGNVSAEAGALDYNVLVAHENRN